jgi:hypothetical protein
MFGIFDNSYSVAITGLFVLVDAGVFFCLLIRVNEPDWSKMQSGLSIAKGESCFRSREISRHSIQANFTYFSLSTCGAGVV